jgi:uncharacterized phage protein gp47/JayE
VLEIPTLRDLRLAAESDLQVEASSVLPQSLRRALAYALAGIGYLYLTALQFLSRQLFLDTAASNFALLWASIFGVEPNPATQAQGTVQVFGAEGSSLVGGEILERSDGVQFTVDGPYTFDETEEVTASVTAVEAGDDGNTAATTTLTFQSPPAGVEAEAIVTGSDGITDGFDAETVASVQERTLAQIRAPRRGGSEEDYEIWAREVSGVAQAYALGSFAGIGTVQVIIAKTWDPTDPLDTPEPSLALIAEVEAYLYARKPAGLYLVAVQPPVLQDLDPYIVLDPDTADIRSAVTNSLALYLASIRPGETAYFDDMVLAIDRAAGEVHHRLFVDDGLGNFGSYDTELEPDSLLVPGTITWTEPP